MAGRLGVQLRATLAGWGGLRDTPYGIAPIAILATVALVENLDDGAFTLALPTFVRRGISVPDIVNLLVLVAFVQLFGNLVAGYFGERTRRVPFLSVGTLISGVACSFTGFCYRYGTLGTARAIDTGIGTNAANVPIGALTSDYYPPSVRVRVFSLLSAAQAVGVIVALPLSAVLINLVGIRSFFLGVGLVLVAVAVLVQLRLPEPARGGMERRESGLAAVADVEDEPLSFGETWRAVFAVRTIRRLFVGDIAAGVAQQAVALFLILLLADVYHLGVVGLALFQLPQLVVGLVTRFFAGAAIDRILLADAPRALRIYGAFATILAVATLSVGFEPPIVVLEIPVCLAAFGGALVGPSIQALYSEVLPARIRTLGFQITGLANVPALVIATPLLTSLYVNHGYSGVFFVAAPFYLLAGGIYATSGGFFETDKANALALTAASRTWEQAKAAGARQLLSCRGVRVAYDGVPVLFGVDLEVNQGELVALLGTNGAGKSSLLRAICGTQEASGGAILFDGRDVTHMPPHEIARRGIVQMPGGKGVFGDLSVRDNLALGGWIRSDPGLAEDTDEVLALFPVLRRRLDEPAGVLSGGEQQMLALALAFLMKPRLLLIDELSLGLSPAAVAELVGAVRRIHASGVAVIVVEQSVALALQLAERAVFMEKGQVRFDGPTADLQRRPDIVRAIYVRGAVTGPAARTDPRAPSAARTTYERPDLAVRGLTKCYGGVRALQDVSFELAPGEVLGVIGPNGSGKTTLFDVLSGMVPADAGEVELLGSDVTRASADARYRAGLVRRFQDARQFPTLSVFETLLLALDARLAVKNPALTSLGAPSARRSERRARARAEEVLGLLDLGAFRDKATGELSTGQRRIVDLACVIAAEPKVLLLDEPSTGIAQAEAERLAPLLRRVQAESGCSILIIEHHMPLLREVSDRFLALATGTLMASGDPDDVLNHPDVTAAYLGAAAPALTASTPTGGTS